MDGNGRWAKARNLPRTEGHQRGEDSLFDVIEGAIEVGVKYLSAYAFSTENWSRSPDEVRWLMGFNRDVIRRRRDQMDAMGVRVRWAGRRPRLWRSVISELEEAERRTIDNDVLTLQFCVNYGGRAEIVDATRRIAELAAAGRLDPSKITEQRFRQYPRRARHPRRRPVRPVVRGAADLELPALAVRVRRAGLPGPALAGLRPPRPVARDRAVRRPRPPVRRSGAEPESDDQVRAPRPMDVAARSSRWSKVARMDIDVSAANSTQQSGILRPVCTRRRCQPLRRAVPSGTTVTSSCATADRA